MRFCTAFDQMSSLRKSDDKRFGFEAVFLSGAFLKRKALILSIGGVFIGGVFTSQEWTFEGKSVYCLFRQIRSEILAHIAPFKRYNETVHRCVCLGRAVGPFAGPPHPPSREAFCLDIVYQRPVIRSRTLRYCEVGQFKALNTSVAWD
jgi:hypothetical protein